MNLRALKNNITAKLCYPCRSGILLLIKSLVVMVLLTTAINVSAGETEAAERFPDQVNSWLQNYSRMQSVADDGGVWIIDNRLPTLAIGDVHGDFTALVSILTEMNLIDSDGKWTGRQVNLVFIGDLINGAGDSRYIADLLMELEKSVRLQGGTLSLILGNHEVEIGRGNVKKMPEPDQHAFLKFPIEGHVYDGMEEIFSSENKYSDWLSRFQFLVKINGVLFGHAGLQGWLAYNSPGEINSTWRSWQKYFSGRSRTAPPAETNWIFSEAVGPSHLREFHMSRKRSKKAITKRQIDYLLQLYGARAFVKGHDQTPDSEILFKHPTLGSRVISIDTGISEAKQGEVRALWISADGEMKSLQFDRTERKDSKKLRKRLKEDMKRPLCSGLFN